MILLDKNPKNTEECVFFLNEKVKLANWKTKANFMLKNGDDTKVRIFTDGESVATIIDKRIFPNLDLELLSPLITRISEVAKTFYTYDNGQVFFDPFTLKLHIVCSDAGWFYSDKPFEEIKELEEEGDLDFNDFDEKDFNDFDGLSSITDVEYADEWFPNFEGNKNKSNSTDEVNFIHITNIYTF